VLTRVPLTLWGSSSLAGCEAGSCRDSTLNDERGVAVQILEYTTPIKEEIGSEDPRYVKLIRHEK
jgi:hypothetical protein